MSERDIISQNKYHNNNSKINSEDLSNIFSNKSSLYIKNKNHSRFEELKSSSIKRILTNGQLNPRDYISLSFNKNPFLGRIKNIRHKKGKEVMENEEESIATMKYEDDPPSPQILNRDKQDMILDAKNKNDVFFSSDIPLLKDRISNTFSNIENLPKKYINLIILCNKITISLDYLKCFYITLFFCGIFNLIYFFDILFDKNKSSSNYDNFYHIFYFPLSTLLMITGIYGYKKINENVYDDELCIWLTYACFFSPICNFALSRISSEDNVRNNIMMNYVVNFISCFFSFFCIIILKEAERVKNSEKNIFHA